MDTKYEAMIESYSKFATGNPKSTPSQTVNGTIKEVAKRIANLPEINGVIILLGRFDILAIGLFEGLSEVHQVASNKILDLEGVRLVETSVVVDVVKYDNRV